MLQSHIDKFTNAYIEAALWSSIDDDGEPLDKKYNKSNISDETLLRMKNDCYVFLLKTIDIIRDDICYHVDAISQAGHDFWLTRNRHGAGFWETSNWQEQAGKTLTKFAHEFGEFNLYIGITPKLICGQ